MCNLMECKTISKNPVGKTHTHTNTHTKLLINKLKNLCYLRYKKFKVFVIV